MYERDSEEINAERNCCLEYELPAPTAFLKIHARASVRFYEELSRWQGGNWTDVLEKLVVPGDPGGSGRSYGV